MKACKLIIEDEIPLMVTYKINMCNEFIVLDVVNIISCLPIPEYDNIGTCMLSQNCLYQYATRVLAQHLNIN